jgi:hypothetical protein
MFDMAHAAASSGDWPWLGMASGAGLVNPGFSVWPFVLFAHLSSTPLGMTMWVIALNVATVLLWMFWWLRRPQLKDRELWAWGLCLYFINPLAVVYSRKIWAQDIVPFFVFFYLLAFEARSKKIGAFFWGLVAPLIGQIHMSGFFACGALALFSFAGDFRRERRLQHFGWWVLGSCAGAWPLVFWFESALKTIGLVPRELKEILTFKFFTQSFANATGVNVRTLFRGANSVYKDFLMGPHIAGWPTFLVGALTLVLIGLGLWGLYRLIAKKNAYTLDSSTKNLMLHFFLAGGVALQLSRSSVHAHYIIVFFPILYLFAARLLIDRPRPLRLFVVSQALMTFFFMLFIRINGGVPGGNYGLGYRAQNSDKLK